MQHVAGDFVPVIRNNLCVGRIPLTNSPKPDAGGNLLLKSLDEAGFVSPRGYDYHLKHGSPAIDRAIDPGKADNFDLTPAFQYLHPCASEKRATAGPLDIGAFEFGRKEP